MISNIFILKVSNVVKRILKKKNPPGNLITRTLSTESENFRFFSGLFFIISIGS